MHELRDTLQLRMDSIAEAVKGRGGRTTFQIGAPAREGDVENAGIAIGAPLSPSHATFLQAINGFDIRAYAEPLPAQVYPSGIYSLSVFGASELVEETLRLRLLADHYGGSIGEYDTSLSNRYARIATMEDVDYSIVMTLDRPSNLGEYPIFEIDERESEWLSPVGLGNQHATARDFPDFIFRCLDNMVEHCVGFRYWLELKNQTDLWE